jgi:hypothetical protein
MFYRKHCRKNFKKGSFDRKLKVLVTYLIVGIDWRATIAPLTPTISPNTSNLNFEIDILFNVVESSGIRSLLGVVVETSKRTHSIGN